MSKSEIFLVIILCGVFPLGLLIYFATELALENSDVSQTIANVTASKDEIKFGDGRKIYYEYEFKYDKGDYIGADYKSFGNSQLAEARQFANQTLLQIYFCKRNPKENGFGANVCVNSGWILGVAFMSMLLIAVWVSFFTNGGLHICGLLFKRKKQDKNTNITPGAI